MARNAKVSGKDNNKQFISFILNSFFGCNLNGNNFIAEEECESICNGKIPEEKVKPKESNPENDKFCDKYEKEHPGIKQIIELTNEVKNPNLQRKLLNVMVRTVKSPSEMDTLIEQIQSFLENGGSNIENLNDFLDQLGDLDSTFNSINSDVIPWLLEVGEQIPRRLWWSTVLSTNCAQAKVRIRYQCIKNPIEIFNITDELFESVCNDLIPLGLKKHYERNITKDGVTRELIIEPLRIP